MRSTPANPLATLLPTCPKYLEDAGQGVLRVASGTGTYRQRATIVETGTTTTSATYSGPGGEYRGSDYYDGQSPKGDMVATGAATGSNRVTGGGGGSHTYCSGHGPTRAAAGLPGSSVRVEVWQASACNPVGTNTLFGTSDVVISNRAAFKRNISGGWDMLPGSNCWWRPPGGDTVRLGSINVSSGGGGSSTFTLPSSLVPNRADEASAICVGTSVLGDQIAVPFQVLG